MHFNVNVNSMHMYYTPFTQVYSDQVKFKSIISISTPFWRLNLQPLFYLMLLVTIIIEFAKLELVCILLVSSEVKYLFSSGSDVVDWLYHHVEGFTDRRGRANTPATC